MGWSAKPEEGILRCWRGDGHPEGEGEECAAPGQSCRAPPDLELHPVTLPGLSMFLVSAVSRVARFKWLSKATPPVRGKAWMRTP